MTRRDDVSGIVLAGGASRRFGRDKLREHVGGMPLLHRPVRALGDICGEVVVVVGPEARAPDLPAVAATLRIARDRVAGEGPLAGLVAGLAAVASPRALVVAGDMPSLAPALLAALAAEGARSGAPALALTDDAPGAPVRPLPMSLAVAAAREAAQRLFGEGERSLRALLATLDATFLPSRWWRALDADGRWRRDVDEPADLEREL